MYEYKCKLVKVVDGDTIDIDIDLGFGVWLQKQRIRLYGIDTPESRTSDATEKIYGMAAKEFLTKWTNSGGLTIKTHKDAKGKFGRILGDFAVYDLSSDSERHLTEMMISDGYGVKYEGQNKDDISTAHLKNRERLIAEGKA